MAWNSDIEERMKRAGTRGYPSAVGAAIDNAATQNFVPAVDSAIDNAPTRTFTSAVGQGIDNAPTRNFSSAVSDAINNAATLKFPSAVANSISNAPTRNFMPGSSQWLGGHFDQEPERPWLGGHFDQQPERPWLGGHGPSQWIGGHGNEQPSPESLIPSAQVSTVPQADNSSYLNHPTALDNLRAEGLQGLSIVDQDEDEPKRLIDLIRESKLSVPSTLSRLLNRTRLF